MGISANTEKHSQKKKSLKAFSFKCKKFPMGYFFFFEKAKLRRLLLDASVLVVLVGVLRSYVGCPVRMYVLNIAERPVAKRIPIY